MGYWPSSAEMLTRKSTRGNRFSCSCVKLMQEDVIWPTVRLARAVRLMRAGPVRDGPAILMADKDRLSACPTLSYPP